MKKNIIIITGPTGVGKTDFSEQLAHEVQGEIINVDVGQFYTKLSIGTAKPDLCNVTVPHHLFNLIDSPRDFTVTEYRKIVLAKIDELIKNNKTPILVGGSGFYIQSLFFPPKMQVEEEMVVSGVDDQLWDKLNAIDPERAQAITKNDTYRLARALSIYTASGIKPSACKPEIELFFDSLTLIVLDRDTTDLYARINKRTEIMLHTGWLEEVAQLPQEWQQFLMRKKIIGYDEILSFHVGAFTTLQELIARIQQKTRNYAKRQRTFFRRLVRILNEEKIKKNLKLDLYWINLSDKNQMLEQIITTLKKS